MLWPHQDDGTGTVIDKIKRMFQVDHRLREAVKMSGAALIAAVCKREHLISLCGKVVDLRQIIRDARSHSVGKNK